MALNTKSHYQTLVEAMKGLDKCIYSSKPFEFVVNGLPLYIHADLVSLHSKVLDRHVNGHMVEAQKGSSVIEDVDEETFVRFIQWAYNGYYSAADFNVETEPISSDPPNEDQNVPNATSHPEYGEVEDAPAAERKKAKKGKKASWFDSKTAGERVTDLDLFPSSPSSRDTLRNLLAKRNPAVPQETFIMSPPRSNEDKHEDYTNVFLLHAQLYVFADMNDIQPLRILAIENLRGTLERFTLHKERTGDIVKLLRYIYRNTGESKPGVEDLRTLLTLYIGIEMDILMKDESFKNLMIEEGGPLLKDFMSAVRRRI